MGENLDPNPGQPLNTQALSMKKIFIKLICAAGLILSAELRAEDDEAAMELDVVAEADGLRLSAIVSAGTRYFAGFVDAETGAASLVPEGGKIKQWRVEFIDEERHAVG